MRLRSSVLVVAMSVFACNAHVRRDAASSVPEVVGGSERVEPIAEQKLAATDALPALPTLTTSTESEKPRSRAWANLDPGDDYVVGPPTPIGDCEGELKRAGVTFTKATLSVHAVKLEKSRITCGASQVVTYLKGPGGIAYNAPPLLTCKMAAALASFETVAQEEAMAILKSPIVRIDQLGTYNCREMVAYPGNVSEHAYANAIDIARFALKDGRIIDVVRDFDVRGGTPRTSAGIFLRKVSRRAHDEDLFSHVLTPFYDAVHKNHFHLDLARFRTDGTRPRI